MRGDRVRSYNVDVSTVREIEQAISNLTPNGLAEFRAWFAEFEAKQWDEQFEQDVKAGKLDSLADEALADLKAGRCTDF
jgi:hypothetical protein